MVRSPIALLTLFAATLAGCTPEGTPGEGKGADGQASITAPADATPTPASLDIQEKNDVYTFEYSYPDAAGRIAGLKALLDARQAEAHKAHVEAAINARADADAGGYPYRPYGYGTKWEVVADLPDWLSLSADHWEYTGGAHPNSGFDALLWDKQAGAAHDPISLFTSADALEEVVKPDFCRMLDMQRARKRGQPVVRDDEDWQNACIGLESVTVILGSSNRRTFDRVGFLVPPYAAGPYAEGSYEVTLPVNAAMVEAVKPEFRDAFSAVQ